MGQASPFERKLNEKNPCGLHRNIINVTAWGTGAMNNLREKWLRMQLYVYINERNNSCWSRTIIKIYIARQRVAVCNAQSIREEAE